MSTAKAKQLVGRLYLKLNNLTLLLLLNQVSVAGAAFVINLFSTATLAPDARGEMAFYLQLAFVLQTLALFGTDRSFILLFPRGESYSVSRSFIRINLLGLSLFVAFATAAAVLSFVFPDAKPFIYLALVFLFVTTGIFGVLIRVSFILDKERTTRIYLSSTFVVQGALIALSFSFFLFGVEDVRLWIALYPISGLFYFFFGIFLFKDQDNSLVGKELRKKLQVQGWKLFPYHLTSFAVQKADRLLLPFLASTSELGRYVFVVSILELAAWPVIQWIDTQIGKWREHYQDGRGLSVSKISRKPFLGSAILAVFVSLFAYVYIKVFLSEEYQSAAILILPLALAVIFRTYGRLMSALLIAQERLRLTTILEVVGLALSLVLFIWLIPIFGALGACFGLLGSSLISFILRFFLVHRSS